MFMIDSNVDRKRVTDTATTPQGPMATPSQTRRRSGATSTVTDWDNLLGLNPDAFPNDATQWNDTDGDGYGDNLNGRNADQDHEPSRFLVHERSVPEKNE